jgi:4-methoxybenzoate monooxygenase (O-demethylating)
MRRARSLIFGGGPHHCLGQRIARLEAECFLVVFVRRFAGLTLAGPPVWYAVNMLRALERLPLELTPA